MAKWNIREITGRQYIYVSKNATSDVAAANFFGKAAAWVSNGAYAIGDRVTSVSIQYRNKTGVNTTTAPASDATNWEFDFENYQTYSTSRSYLVGHKTNYSNEHYVCITNTTGTFNPAHWNKVIISNKDVPYKLMNTAVNLINGDARFVSFEELDYTNNVATHNIHIVLSNGIWNETLTAPAKFIRIVGQSKWKTKLSSLMNFFYEKLNATISTSYNYNTTINCKFYDCFFADFMFENTGETRFIFMYKNIILNTSLMNYYSAANVYHFVNNTILGGNFLAFNTFKLFDYSVFKNNYIKANINFPSYGGITGVGVVSPGAINYNSYEGIVKVNGVSQTSLSMLQATLPNQNLNSRYDSGVTFNSDGTLSSGSVLLGTGSNGNNIGAEGRGYVDTTSTIFTTANGAIFKNLKITGTYVERDQISKLAQANSDGKMVLNSSASSTNDIYNGFRIYISSGTGSGQTRTISAYNGSLKQVTVSVAWTTLPDATSVYEILDGELTSGIGDLGSVQTLRKMLFANTPVYKAADLAIDQAVSISDPRLDNPAGMIYDLKYSNASDLGGASFVRFVQDEEFKIDSGGKGCGSSDYNPDNVVSNTLTFRYYQVKLMFRK